ncbi:acyl-CoA dehydrogenase family protein [Rhizobium mongolense]|uniref:Alkylation response protein AidB-like acyl-CoA dehydrogenase n=1 Tax=Rhizobium mongolense TaxID=57676 RepID=A0A7W6RQV0_9HYPH|nr:acyl-CoA dehydrogenase family protein [Rhizobium mongolense]MBB4276752.1 alkylation response protein AidB-like acyl-CoA dehydrogenase [Rhizobium mongolense]
MGTASQFHDRPRPVAQRIESEEEAINTARTLAAAFQRQSSERDINRILPYQEIDALSQSGLGAITVPPEYEGLDIANSLLAEIVAIIAEGDPSIGEFLEVHFTVLDGFRQQAGEELQRALFARVLAGDRFAAAAFADAAAISSRGLGYRVNGRSTSSPAVLFADWIAVGHDQTTLYLSSDSEGLQLVDDWDGLGQRTNGTAAIVASDLHVNADAVALVAHAPSAIGELLHAAVDLGIARAVLSADAGAAQANDIGKLAVGIETVAALLERAGRKLDIAQINMIGPAAEDAYFSASAARAVASQLAIDASNLIFELVGENTASIGLNLDRHWRNARIRALRTPADVLHQRAAHHVRKDR